MQRFSVTEIQNTHTEVLNQASVEPVLLTEESQPNYVIMSIENYEQLMNRLTRLEDSIGGQQAEAALSKSRMVGTETFTAELKRLVTLDDNSWLYGKTWWSWDGSWFSQRLQPNADLVEVILVGKRNDDEVYKQMKRLLVWENNT